MITFTEVARAKIVDLLHKEERGDLVLRLAIAGRGPGGFRYRLGFVPRAEQAVNDSVVDGGGFQVLVDADSAPNLKGVAIDYVENLQESGFRVDNPNSAWTDPIAQAVQGVIDQDINPAVASHGGYVVLHEMKDGVAYIELHGGCQGCGMAAVTLRQGIEVRIKELVPAVREVVDVTDHARGANPYYASSEGGQSPLG